MKWETMFQILKRVGGTRKDRRIIKSSYEKETEIIECGNSQKETKIRKGVRQGCTLSPSLFNLYIHEAINKVREEIVVEIRINEEKINMQGLQMTLR